ncbi:MAG: bifunctional oligoribonuclease/PAP phosphatase NrnA [Deltaproteobacteria bacterium]|jgi:phosphoesterase RecJ-like protein|nr:bifunctional oligoribonuclease/PAP phosphatase NrnA [Deltaproteobacteria bacterium]
MKKIINHLKNSNHIIIASHKNPDGDAIGSLIAMGLALEALNKNITLYNESSIPSVYRFLPSVERIVRQIKETNTYDTAIILDCADFQRIGKISSVISKIPVIINIDHHITNTRFGNFNLIDTSACAAAEIIYNLLIEMALPISNSAIATSIYTGILTDTGSFRFSNTNKSAFAICEKMVEAGVDPYNVARHVYGRYSLGQIKLLNMALESIEISDNGKMSMMILTKDMLDETGTLPEDIDGLINYAKSIENVKVAALIHELSNGKGVSENPENYHVSLRSDETVDVAAIAGSFGGGGHNRAAGFNIESTLSDIKTQMLNIAVQL